ncbi:hypothetical protein Tco_1234254 [Tanacetum coccineum]
MDTESEPFEDPIKTESPLTVAPPTSLPETVPPAMSPGLFASMAEVAAMFESAFRKRYRSFYESSPSLSPPNLPLRKRYWGTSELVEDDEEDDDEDDDEIEESLDSDSVSEDVEDEGPTAEDEDPATGTRVLLQGSRASGHSVESDRLGLGEEEEAVPGGQQQVVPVMRTAVIAPLGLGYRALRRREQPTLTTWTDPEDGMVYIDVLAYPPPAPLVQTPPLPEWLSGSLPISPSPFIASYSFPTLSFPT